VTDPPPAAAGVTASATSIAIADGALVEIPGASGADVSFEGASGTLQLDQSSAFTGTILGFAGGDQIDLSNVAWANATLAYQPDGAGTGGTLSVGDGAHTAKLALLGQYAAGNFSLAMDGHGGTIVTDPPLFGPVPVNVDPVATATDRQDHIPTSAP